MLETLCILMLCAAIQGAMSAQLEYFMREGMILQNWLPFIAKILVNRNVKLKAKIADDQSRHTIAMLDKNMLKRPVNPIFETNYIELAERYCFFYRPLGGCAICMNTWLSFGSFWLVWLILPELSVLPTILLFFSYTFLSGGFLKLFMND